jgi:hypothetical protein
LHFSNFLLLSQISCYVSRKMALGDHCHGHLHILFGLYFAIILLLLYGDFLMSRHLNYSAEIVSLFLSEVMFYIGLATFLCVTEHVQKPYLQFSAKRWSLITGLRGYLTSAFFTMGFKVFAPLFVVYATWPVLGFPALVSVAPFLVGCLVQYAFEKRLESRGSSSWPLVPILFEVYKDFS